MILRNASRGARNIAAAVALLGCCAMAACSRGSSGGSAAASAPANTVATGSAAGKQYRLRGKVIGVDESGGSVVVSHEAVPGFMGAMTMAYKVKDASVLTELHPGDRISATLVVPGNDDYFLQDVVITAQGKPDYKPATEYHVPTPDDAAPAFSFRDQGGRMVQIASFKGQVVVVTFVYTRCPLSDYCPRMSRNFAQIDKALSADPKAYAGTHLLTVSFDPQYDTPAVLRSYGEAYTGRYTKEDFAHWTFAAPRPADLQPVEQWFGVGVTPGENNTLAHSLSTCVFGRDGRLVAWYPTNDWTVEQVMADVHRAL